MATCVGDSQIPGSLEANIKQLQQARIKDQVVSVGLMKGRTVVKTASRWNLLLRLYYLLQGSKGTTQLHDEMKRVLEDKGVPQEFKREVFEEITSGACPVLEVCDDLPASRFPLFATRKCVGRIQCF